MWMRVMGVQRIDDKCYVDYDHVKQMHFPRTPYSFEAPHQMRRSKGSHVEEVNRSREVAMVILRRDVMVSSHYEEMVEEYSDRTQKSTVWAPPKVEGMGT